MSFLNATNRVTVVGAGGGGGGGGSPDGPVGAIQFQSDPTGTFDGTGNYRVSTSLSTSTIIVGSTDPAALSEGFLTLIANDGNPVQLLIPMNPGQPLAIRLPGGFGGNGNLITTDGSGNWSYINPTSLGGTYFDIAGSASAAQTAAISASETYTDGAIATAIGGLPSPGPSSVGGAGTVDTADGSGGWTATGVTISGGVITCNDVSAFDCPSLGALATQVAAIAAQLAGGVSGTSTTVSGSISSSSGIVTAIS